MKITALVTLLSCPAALAFIPADLRGVWSCVPEDGTYYVDDQLLTSDVTWKSVEPEKQHRVVVFDKPDDKAKRLFHGRTYYSFDKASDQDLNIEEHDIVGTFTNSLQGDFFLTPNLLNAECGGTIADLTPKINLATTPAGGRYNDVSGASTSYATSGASDPQWLGHCSAHAAGPYNFVMDDADHFTLQLSPKDRQHNYMWEFGNGGAGVGSTHSTREHVFVIEKCMRGLPESSVLCDNLQHSDIDSTQDMNDACQGALQCLEIDSNAASKGHHCAIPAPVAAVQYLQQPYYQPQYYQPQFYQPQVNYAPFSSSPYQPSNFWG